MSVDNAPATNALNLLNGIDYGAVIGAPLQAAITAQAMAAKSTWEFIQEVGLNTDENGNKTAVNVDFTYQKDGEMVKLIVPILTIVPIPAIVVTDIDIAFKANINASASQSSQTSETTDVGGELSGGAKVGWGAFSLDTKFKANYSSKKDSKATQDSRYSVEYTQDVSVKAAQAGMPAGLATVLNILSNAATGASLDGDLMVSPALVSLDLDNLKDTKLFSIKVVDSNGLNAGKAKVTIKPDPNAFSETLAIRNMGIKAGYLLADGSSPDITKAIDIGLAPLGTHIKWDDDKQIKVDIGKDGKVDLIVGLTNQAKSNLPHNGNFCLEISAEIDGEKEPLTDYLYFKVDNLSIEDTLTVDGGNTFYLPVSKTGKKDSDKEKITVALKDSNGISIESKEITAAVENGNLKVIDAKDESAGGETTAKATTDDKGQASFKLWWSGTPKSGDTGSVEFSANVDDGHSPTPVTVTVTTKTSEFHSPMSQLPQAQGYSLSIVNEAPQELVPAKTQTAASHNSSSSPSSPQSEEQKP